MIDGEHGEAILAHVVALQMDALLEGGDTTTVALIGNCIADAIRKGETPQQVAWSLFESVPGDEAWEGGLRDKVIQAVEEFEERQAA